MSGMKDKQSGDYAPSRAPFLDIGRFRLTPIGQVSGQVWIRDLESGEAGAFEVAKLEAAVRRFFSEGV